jgi:polyisoprenoid-binding protein YceI
MRHESKFGLGNAITAALVTLLLLASCRTAPPRATSPGTIAATAPSTTSVGSALYSIDTEASQVLVLVYREGAMAALGHNHVMNVRGLTGSVQLFDDLPRTRFELGFNVADISVDEPALRTTAGADFTSKVSDAARTGTRTNMLGDKLLQAVGFPRISLKSEHVTPGTAGDFVVTTRLMVRGSEYSIDVPLHLQRDGDELYANGEFALKQSALGLTPYSVMLGALRVVDEMQIRYQLVAHRVRL